MKNNGNESRATESPCPWRRMIFLNALALLAFSAPSLADLAGLNAELASSTNDLLDYVVQDVCVDGDNNAIAGDPATCAAHRNLRIGERIPYLRTDFDTVNGNATYQALWSFPVPSVNDATLRVMTSKSNQGGFTSAYTFNFSVSRDGFDLMDTSGPYFSYIRTSDGGCLDQEISESATERLDGWILFPQLMGSGMSIHSISIRALSPHAPAGCGGTGTSAEDVWNPPGPVTYETGKTLSTLVAYHIATVDLRQENNAIERTFFTREYGATRWEAWIPLSRCRDPKFAGSPVATGHPEYCDPMAANNPLRGRCNPSGIPATTTWGNQAWIRVDCRDSTQYIPLATPLIPLDKTMGQSDGLIDLDSAAVLNAPER